MSPSRLLTGSPIVDGSPSNKDRKESGDKKQEAARISALVRPSKESNTIIYLHLDNNKSHKQLDKPIIKAISVAVSMGSAHICQSSSQRVLPALVVEIMPEQPRRCEVSDKDRKVEERGNKLEGIA